jgi:hypothetical protein
MRQEETIDGAIEDNDFYVIIRFQCRDDLVQLRYGFGTKDIQGRVVKGNTPVRWRPSCETNLCYICHFAHVCFQDQDAATSKMASNSTGVPSGRLPPDAMSGFQRGIVDPG